MGHIKFSRKKFTAWSVVQSFILGMLVMLPISISQNAGATTNVSCGTAVSPNASYQNNLKVSPVHGSVFYIDTGQNQTVDASYVGYTINANASLTNLWASLDSFSGGAISLANPNDAFYPIGSLVNGGTATVYFLLKASRSNASAQSHTIHIYQGRPDLLSSSEKYACNFSFIKVAETIKAAANKVTSIAPSTTSLVTGTDLTVTVRGFTGTIGKGSPLDGTMMLFSPASSSSWPTGSLRLSSTQVKLYNKKNMNNGSLVSNGTFNDILYIKKLSNNTGTAIASGAAYYYTATYVFNILGPSPTAPSVAPVAQISSGTQIKHTDLSSLPSITVATNTITTNAQVTKTASSTVTIVSNKIRIAYTINLINFSTSSISFDQVIDAASANLTYVSGSVQAGGSSYPDPTLDSLGRWIFAQPITVTGAASAGSSRTVSITYTMESKSTCTGSTPFSFLNTVSANIGSLIIGDSTATISGVTTSGTCSSSSATVTTTSTAIDPEVSTTAATGLSITGSTANATLNGTVNPHGNSGSATVFEYGTDSGLAGATSVYPSANANTAGETTIYAISKALTGLTPNQTYYYRVKLTTSSSTFYGAIFSFTTQILPSTPTVTTNPATNVSTSGADLNGSVNPNATSTTIYFQYKAPATQNGTCTLSELGSPTSTAYVQGDSGNLTLTSSSPTEVVYPLTGLTSGTYYCYRVVATSGSPASDTTGSWVVFRAVTMLDQSITFTSVPTSVNISSSSTVTATTNATGLTVTYTSNSPTICSVDLSTGAVSTTSVAGTCSITATQTGNTTYYAATPVTVSFPVIGPVTLSYNLNGATGGTTPTSQNVVIGQSTTVNDPAGTITKTNFSFAGWNTSPLGNGTFYAAGGSITMSSNITLYALWNATIAYSGNSNTGGSAPSSYTGVAGVVALQSNSGSLVRTNYSFNGWNSNDAGTGTHYNVSSNYNLSGNVTLYAEWIPDTYWRITYYGMGNTGGTVPGYADVLKGNSYLISSSVPTKTNLSFSGWNTALNYSGSTYAASATIPSSAITGNLGLYAIWKGNVTYDGNSSTGGSAPAAQNNLVEGSTFTTGTDGSGPSKLVRTGYTFAGWNTKTDGTGDTYLSGTSYKFSGTMVLYAKWQPNPITITFNDNSINGTAVTSTQDTFYNVATKLNANSFSANDGSVFGGWATSASNATNKISLISDLSTVTLTTNTTYYAAWNTSYTVTYNATNANNTSVTSGTAPVDINSPYGSGSSVTVLDNSDLSLTNYTFAAWCTTVSASNSLTACSTGTRYTAGSTFTINANTNLYPIWTEITYSISIVNPSSGGSAITSLATVSAGGSATLTATASTGYVFSSWSCSGGGTLSSSTTNPATLSGINSNATCSPEFLQEWKIEAFAATYKINGTVPTLTATVTPSGGLSGALDCKIYAGSDTGFLTPKPIDNTLTVGGSYVVRCMGTAASGYVSNPTITTATFTVTDKTLSFIYWATPTRITYGTALSGTQLNAKLYTAANGGGTELASNCIYTPGSGVLSAGNQTLSATCTPTDNTYSQDSGNVVLIVDPINLTYTVSAANKSYDGNDLASLTVGNLVGILDGDSASVTFDKSKITGKFVNANVGDTKTVNLTFNNPLITGPASGNYTITNPNNPTANITKIDLHVNADDQIVQQGSSIGTLAYTVNSSDLVGSDNTSVVSGVTCSTDYLTSDSAGASRSVTCSGGTTNSGCASPSK